MANRTYVPSLLNLSIKLCRTLAVGTPIISRLYGDSAPLMAALAAANAACSELAAQLALVRETGP